ncbi:MAG: hypothetical protein EA397_00675 [Deltaproteobacteria bacterium]|nr:MAG: hypothetical protein EA397_00675 [Deltaproteobacteria bacterium]
MTYFTPALVSRLSKLHHVVLATAVALCPMACIKFVGSGGSKVSGPGCRDVVSHVDAFGKRTRGVVMYNDRGRYQAISVIEHDDRVEFRIMYFHQGTMNVSVPEGTEVMLAFEALGPRSYHTSEEAPAVPTTTSLMRDDISTFTQWQLPITLSHHDFDLLATHPIKAARSEFGGLTVELNVPERRGARIVDGVRCLQRIMPNSRTSPP